LKERTAELQFEKLGLGFGISDDRYEYAFQFAGLFFDAGQPVLWNKSGFSEQFSQYSLSSSSWRDPSSLLIKSTVDLARVPSLYGAPTDVRDLRSWRPNI
jgi:hypothetical protein